MYIKEIEKEQSKILSKGKKLEAYMIASHFF